MNNLKEKYKEVILRLKEEKVVSICPFKHHVHTPYALCAEMLSKVNYVDKDILVISNLEFLLEMNLGSVKSITFITTCDIKEKIANDLLKRYNITSRVVRISDIKELKGLNMKFHIVIGNPPYQDSAENSDSALWLKFANIGMSLLNEDGGLLFLTPTSWTGKQTKNIKAEYYPFTDNHVVLFKPLSDDEKRKYFNVGSTFGYYLIKKGEGDTTIYCDDGSTQIIKLIPGDPLPNKINELSLSIHKKLSKTEKFNFKSDYEFHSQKIKDITSENMDSNHPYKTYFSHSIIRYVSKKQSVFSEVKVMIPSVGTFSNAWVEKDCNFTEDNIKAITVNNMPEGNNLISLFNSKLYQYIGIQYRGGRKLSAAIKFAPKLDITKSWGDQELYKNFNLTKEEIDFIMEVTK